MRFTIQFVPAKDGKIDPDGQPETLVLDSDAPRPVEPPRPLRHFLVQASGGLLYRVGIHGDADDAAAQARWQLMGEGLWTTMIELPDGPPYQHVTLMGRWDSETYQSGINNG
jgi:hypothetical protein